MIRIVLVLNDSGDRVLTFELKLQLFEVVVRNSLGEVQQQYVRQTETYRENMKVLPLKIQSSA